MDIDKLQPSNQRALQGLAQEIIERPVGDRLDTTVNYQRRFGVGAGTLQKALRLIESVGAAELRTAGHQGTFVEFKNVGLLWKLSGLTNIRMSMTPPGAPEHYGLSSGLTTQFERIQVPMVQRYNRGADTRIDLVAQNEADISVISSGAALALRDNPNWYIKDVGPGSYYAADSLTVVHRTGYDSAGAKSIRVGIDRESHDHTRLTRAEYEQESRAEYVDCSFQTIPTAILENRIDAGIWHRMMLLIPLHLCGLATDPIKTLKARTAAQEISGAVLAIPCSRPWVGAVLDAIDLQAVREQQKLVSSETGLLAEQRIWLR